jgi:RimJ/RimL family protein N-acetyltransferase
VRHDIDAEGIAYRLRPVELSDAPFIVALRHTEELDRFLHPISPNVGDQEAYIRSYYERAGDYYFVIERTRDRSPEGTVALYNVDELVRSGEWGRWIVRRGSMAAVESAWLIYRVAFSQLELERVYCRTVAENARVISFHDSCGLRVQRHLPRHFILRGHAYDAVEHEICRSDWPRTDEVLGDRAARLAEVLAR